MVICAILTLNIIIIIKGVIFIAHKSLVALIFQLKPLLSYLKDISSPINHFTCPVKVISQK